MNSTKTEVSIWVFILLVIVLGFIIGILMNTFTDTSKSNNYKEDNETDDYSHIDYN